MRGCSRLATTGLLDFRTTFSAATVRAERRALSFAERALRGDRGLDSFTRMSFTAMNQISTGLALQAPFGGVKKSSTDSFKEQGAGAIDFYTRIKTVYLDYSA